MGSISVIGMKIRLTITLIFYKENKKLEYLGLYTFLFSKG